MTSGLRSRTQPGLRASSRPGLSHAKEKEEIMNQPVVETAAPKAAPILEVAWMRHAQLDQAAGNRTKAFYAIRRWIAWLGVLATLFAILTQESVIINGTWPGAPIAEV